MALGEDVCRPDKHPQAVGWRERKSQRVEVQKGRKDAMEGSVKVCPDRHSRLTWALELQIDHFLTSNGLWEGRLDEDVCSDRHSRLTRTVDHILSSDGLRESPLDEGGCPDRHSRLTRTNAPSPDHTPSF